MPTASQTEREIDARQIEPRFRHRIVQRLFENLAPTASLRLVSDHAPKRLLDQLAFLYGTQCRWSCLEEGPDVWTVRLELVREPVPDAD
jgi:uncharacterized protein (DUF2249 family)